MQFSSLFRPLLLAWLGCALIPSHAAIGLPAFPGAEGFGAQTTHARGKPVCVVTRLDDLNKGQRTRYLEPGQFRHCLALAQETGGGYIVFAVSGTIELRRPAYIPPNVYIAGQSSPGGIAFEGNALIIRNAYDVVIRHIRHREAARKGDAINIENSRNVVIDHVSISFFKDGAVDIVNRSHDITVQWSHMGDSMRSGSRNEPYHGEPNLLRDGVDRVTFHHNLYTHGHSRMPLASRSCRSGMIIEFSNNVVYNFRKYPSSFNAPDGRGNAIGNYYIPGRNTHGDVSFKYLRAVRLLRPAIKESNNFSLFVQDNIMVGGTGHDESEMRGRIRESAEGQWLG